MSDENIFEKYKFVTLIFLSYFIHKVLLPYGKLVTQMVIKIFLS